MQRSSFRLRLLLWLILIGVVSWADASSIEYNPINIKEWHVPYEGRPRDPFTFGGKEIWFVGQAGHYLARYTPSTKKFFKHDLEDSAGPHNLIVSSRGIVWYSGNLKGYIGRYDPQRDQLDKVVIPNDNANDPHTLVFDKNEQYIWFTVQRGNFVGRLKIADLTVELIPVPTQHARPYGIKIAPNGTPWIALLGTHKLANVDPKTLKLTEVEIPNNDARPRRLEVTNDGRIWYSDYATGVLGHYDPKADVFKEWKLPGGEVARPYGTALDKGNRIWIVTGTRPNYFVGFDTLTEKIISITAIPSGGGTVRHMHYHPSSDSIWFGTDTQNLGRAIVKSE